MFRSLLCKSGGTLNRATAIIHGDSSSSSAAAKYFLPNQNVLISISRVTSFSITTSSDDSDFDSSFIVSYLINSCGLTQDKAITASKKLNFKTTSKPDSVLTLLRTYGFTESHICKMIYKHPPVLLSNPRKTLKPKLDFFKSKGIDETELAELFSMYPTFLRQSLGKGIIPIFDILKSLVGTDENVSRLIRRNRWLVSMHQVKRVLINIELLREEGVPETNISKYLISRPGDIAGAAHKFKGIVEKVKEMGFDHLQTTFLKAIHGFVSMSEVNWKKKMEVYKRWGWSEDQIQSAFRKNPGCMTASERKIMAVMNFLVNEMGYDSSDVAENPKVFDHRLKERIIPRCSVIRILVSRGLIKEKIAIGTLAKEADKYFLKNFVFKYEKEVPELMKIFQGQLSYQQLLQN